MLTNTTTLATATAMADNEITIRIKFERHCKTTIDVDNSKSQNMVLIFTDCPR